MNDDLPLNMAAIRRGCTEVNDVIAASKPDNGSEEARRAVAPLIFHQAAANLRNGEFAALDPEIWWQVAEAMQYSVDWWALTGDMHEVIPGGDRL
jgi:hypothetical protein